jgi:hypothetical protein
MGGGQMETPARGQAQPGQDGRLATAAGTCKLADPRGRAKASGLYHVTWALDWLLEAGPRGCTPVTESATLAALGLAGVQIWGRWHD